MDLSLRDRDTRDSPKSCETRAWQADGDAG